MAPRLTIAGNGRLSVREYRVLRRLACGWRIPDIARLEGLTYPEARAAAARLREKLNARNASHTVAQAFTFGLLSPQENFER